MEKFITIDGGTTNTRISLVFDDKIIDTKKYNIGVGGSDRLTLLTTLKNGIKEILFENNTRESEIERILASGMITSEAGICELKHIPAPCGINEMASAMHETVIGEISDIPFVFSRGIRTNTDEVDVMRGEETELMGLFDTPPKDCLYVLPGSHTKLIYIDENGKISDILTSITGEMISAISCDTILRNSVSLKASLNTDYLIKGYLYAKEKGIPFAFFKVRMLDKIIGRSEDEKYSFFIGAALFSDIENMIKAEVKNIIIGGKEELRRPIVILLQSFSKKKITEIKDETARNAASCGIVKIYKHRKKRSNKWKNCITT